MPLEEPEVTSNQPENADDVPPPSKLLKFLVVGQGIAIVILVIIIIGTIAYRAFNSFTSSPDEGTAVAASKGAVSTESVTVEIGHIKAPEGSVLKQVHTDDLIVTLEFMHSNGDTTLIFVDTDNGREKARVFVEKNNAL